MTRRRHQRAQPLAEAITRGPHGFERVGAPRCGRTGRAGVGPGGRLGDLGRGILAELLQQVAVDGAGLPLAPVPLVVLNGVFGHEPRHAVDRPWIEAKRSQSRLDFPHFVAPQRGLVRRRLDGCRLAVRRRCPLRGRGHDGGRVGNACCGRRR
jgi:hypothetical protein